MGIEFLDTATWWLAAAAWAAWLLLGWGNTRAETRDRVFDSSTWQWAAIATIGTLVLAIALAQVLPWASIVGQVPWLARGAGAIVALLGDYERCRKRLIPGFW